MSAEAFETLSPDMQLVAVAETSAPLYDLILSGAPILEQLPVGSEESSLLRVVGAANYLRDNDKAPVIIDCNGRYHKGKKFISLEPEEAQSVLALQVLSAQAVHSYNLALQVVEITALDILSSPEADPHPEVRIPDMIGMAALSGFFELTGNSRAEEMVNQAVEDAIFSLAPEIVNNPDTEEVNFAVQNLLYEFIDQKAQFMEFWRDKLTPIIDLFGWDIQSDMEKAWAEHQQTSDTNDVDDVDDQGDAEGLRKLLGLEPAAHELTGIGASLVTMASSDLPGPSGPRSDLSGFDEDEGDHNEDYDDDPLEPDFDSWWPTPRPVGVAVLAAGEPWDQDTGDQADEDLDSPKPSPDIHFVGTIYADEVRQNQGEGVAATQQSEGAQHPNLYGANVTYNPNYWMSEPIVPGEALITQGDALAARRAFFAKHWRWYSRAQRHQASGLLDLPNPDPRPTWREKRAARRAARSNTNS